jgi:hypothetical protein
MALRPEVVDLVRPDLADDVREVVGVVQVAVVELQPGARHVRVLVDVVEPLGVEARAAPDDPVHFVPLRKQELREVAAVLPPHPTDESFS